MAGKKSDNMNVLYDYSIFQLQRYGGISRYFYELINNFSKNNEVNVNLFEGFHINEYEFSKEKDNFGFYRGFKTPFFKGSGYVLDKFNHIWFNKTYDDFSNLNIFHPTYYRGDVDKFKRSPVVITVYDMIHELYEDQFKKHDPTVKNKRLSINSADAIICISMNTKEDLLKYYNISENNIWVVYLGNSLDRYKSFDPEEVYCQNSIQTPYLLFVGNRGGYKNFSLLLDVYINRFADDFDLICFGGGSFNENEMSIFKKRKLTNKAVQVNGSDRFLASLYRNAFCLIYPSIYEGFGLPLLEAMSLGCPVVASNTSSVPEVVGDAGVLFDPFSNDELISSIELLLNSKFRSKLIAKGFEQEKKFNWDKTASETLNVYKSII